MTPRKQFALLAERHKAEKAGKKRGRPAAQSSPHGKRQKGVSGQAVIAEDKAEGEIPFSNSPRSLRVPP